MQPVTVLPANFISRIFSTPLSLRRNLLLALATIHDASVVTEDPQFRDELLALYKQDADPGVHGLAGQILRRAKVPLPQLDPSASEVSPERGWFTNSLDQTLVIVQTNPSVPYTFAIASCETTREQFTAFVKETQYPWVNLRSDQPTVPSELEPALVQGHLSWYDCAAFCNWLSRREGLEECYLPNAEGKYAAGMSIKANVLTLTGYRLPTASEWQTAAQGGTNSRYFFGNDLFASQEYLWDGDNSGGAVQPPAQLRPNNLGLFDIHGNVSEWNMNLTFDSQPAVLLQDDLEFNVQGGSALDLNYEVFSVLADTRLHPHDRSQMTGLRVVRSLK